MRHFLNDNGLSYGVKEILRDQLPIKYKKVNFRNDVLMDMIDTLVANEVKPGEHRKHLVTWNGDPSMDDGVSPYIRSICVSTREFNYWIFKTEEERDHYYNKFN